MKGSNIMMVGDKEVGTIHYQSHCPVAEKCITNSCYFKLKTLGHTIFCSPGYQPGINHNLKVIENAGVTPEEVHWPKVNASCGTNVMTLYCEEYKEHK